MGKIRCMAVKGSHSFVEHTKAGIKICLRCGKPEPIKS